MCTVPVVLTLAATLYVTCYTFLLLALHLSPFITPHKNTFFLHFSFYPWFVCMCLDCRANVKIFFFKKTSKNAMKLNTKHYFFVFFFFISLLFWFLFYFVDLGKEVFAAQQHLLAFIFSFWKWIQDETEWTCTYTARCCGSILYGFGRRKKSGLLAAAYMV